MFVISIFLTNQFQQNSELLSLAIMGDCQLHLVLSGEQMKMLEICWRPSSYCQLRQVGVSCDILSSDRMSYVDIVTIPPPPPVQSINGQVELVVLIFTIRYDCYCQAPVSCSTEDESLSISNIFSVICQDLIIQHYRDNILQYSNN